MVRESFNPLFIRSVFLFQREHQYLSGREGKFQSLIHQVSVSFSHKGVDVRKSEIICFNPLFIRSVFLLCGCEPSRPAWTSKVSIPYSSGQCFFYRNSGDRIISALDRFNPLFIRSVFLLRSRRVRLGKEQ